jgi:hypothetical protein
MIRNTGSEPAANRCVSSGTAGQVSAFRAFRPPRPLIRQLNPPPERQQHLNRHARTPVLALHAIAYSLSRDEPDHSRPIGRTIVERFSPTRF